MTSNHRGFSSALILIGIAIVAVAGWYFLNAKDGKNTLIQADREETWTIEPKPEGEFIPQFPNLYHNGLVISPQESSAVKADQSYLESPGFIVVRKIFQDSPADVIGVSAYLSSGFHKDTGLNASLVPHSTYFAFLYADDGDKVFDIHKDKQLPLYNGPAKTYGTYYVVQFKTK